MSELRFSARELRDLLAAWLALGVAFALFFDGIPERSHLARFAVPIAVSLGTVGVAFLAHELAHKVVAVRYGQLAAFKADYGMLLLAIAGGLAGFIFAAPGAVVHRGRLTERQRGLIALAGPATNVLLVIPFAGLFFISTGLGTRGVRITLLLAAFNMLPVGGLDGRTVLSWSVPIWGIGALLSVGLTAAAFIFL